jgi:hypothetical protein
MKTFLKVLLIIIKFLNIVCVKKISLIIYFKHEIMKIIQFYLRYFKQLLN